MTDLRASDQKASVDDYLVLPPDGFPKTVYVKFVETLDAPAAGFALTEEGQYYTKGMSWRPTTTSWGLFIDFAFVRGIRDIQTQTFLISQASATAQQCAVAAVAGEYAFLVQLSSGALHDPKIIVTPL